MIAILGTLTAWLLLGALLLSIAPKNRAWLMQIPAGAAAAAIVTWPAFLSLMLVHRYGYKLVDLYDDLRDWLHIFITSRFSK